MLSFFEYIFPIELIVKAILIIVLGIVTLLAVVFTPKGKILALAVGVIAILVVWFIELEINI